MPQVLPTHVPAPRCVIGWDGTAYRAFAVDDSGHIQADVLSSTLPAGAATAAHQLTMITALQLIDDLRNALQSVATDRLRVVGEDQLFSFRGVLAVYRSANPSGANGYIESPAVPAGEVWIVTAITVEDTSRALTALIFDSRHDGVSYPFAAVYRAIAQSEFVSWSGHLYLDEGDTIWAYMTGCQAADECYIRCVGYRMTAET